MAWIIEHHDPGDEQPGSHYPPWRDKDMEHFLDFLEYAEAREREESEETPVIS
jgi:hypothetical protein